MSKKKIIALVAVSIIGVFAIWLGIQVAYYSRVLDRGSQVNVTEIREFCHEKT